MTLFNLLASKKIHYIKRDITDIGKLIAKQARHEKIVFHKITQKEGDWKVRVFDYPTIFVPTMEKMIAVYFLEKKKKLIQEAKEPVKQATPAKQYNTAPVQNQMVQEPVVPIKKKRKRIPLKQGLKRKNLQDNREGNSSS